MKIKFLREFGGRETREIHYPPGFELETGEATVSESVALDLFARGIVEIQDAPPTPAVKQQEIKAEPVEQPAPHSKRGGK